MELKPGYKLTEVGVIPEEWEVKTIHELSRLVTVGFVGSMSHLFRRQGVPLLRGQNVLPGKLDLTDTRFIDKETHVLWQKSALRPRDVVIVRVGYPGTCATIPEGFGEANAASLVIVRPNDRKLNPDYLCCILLSPIGKQQIEAALVGGAQQVINIGTATNLLVPTPTLPEQCAIAEALSDVDGLLDGLDRLIAKKRDLKQAAMQQLLTGQTRLPGFGVKEQTFRQTDFGMLPSDWEVPKIESIVDEISMGPFGSDIKVSNFISEGVPVLSGANVGAESLKDSFENFVSFAKAKSLKKAVSRRGDIVVTHRGTLGQISYIPADSAYDRYVISQSQFRVRFIDYLVNPAWVVLYFRSEQGAKRLLEGKGHTGVPAIAQPTRTFRNLSIPLPSLPEQAVIAAVLADMDAEVAALERRREKTRALKQAMMQELLTGRTRLVESDGSQVTKTVEVASIAG
jgi:type I restriction enzyme, S subunit